MRRGCGRWRPASLRKLLAGRCIRDLAHATTRADPPCAPQHHETAPQGSDPARQTAHAAGPPCQQGRKGDSQQARKGPITREPTPGSGHRVSARVSDAFGVGELRDDGAGIVKALGIQVGGQGARGLEGSRWARGLRVCWGNGRDLGRGRCDVQRSCRDLRRGGGRFGFGPRARSGYFGLDIDAGWRDIAEGLQRGTGPHVEHEARWILQALGDHLGFGISQLHAHRGDVEQGLHDHALHPRAPGALQLRLPVGLQVDDQRGRRGIAFDAVFGGPVEFEDQPREIRVVGHAEVAHLHRHCHRGTQQRQWRQ